MKILKFIIPVFLLIITITVSKISQSNITEVKNNSKEYLQSIKKEFNLQDYIEIIISYPHSIYGAFNPDTLKNIYFISKKIQEIDEFISENLISLTTKEKIKSSRFKKIDFLNLMGYPSFSPGEASRLKDEIKKNSIFQFFLLSSDEKSIKILVPIKSDVAAKSIIQKTEAVILKNIGKETYLINKDKFNNNLCYLIFSGDKNLFKQPKALEYINNLQAYLYNNNFIQDSISLVDIVKKIHFKIPNSASDIEKFIKLFKSSNGGKDIWKFTNPDYNKINIWIKTDKINMLKKTIKQYISKNPVPYKMDFRITGKTYNKMLINKKIKNEIIKISIYGFGIFIIILGIIKTGLFSDLYLNAYKKHKNKRH